MAARRIPEPFDQDRTIPAFGAGLEPVEQPGVADQDLAVILARAEDLEQDLGRPGVGGQPVERLVEPRDGGEEAFEIGEGHARVGASRQDRVELDGDPCHAVQPLRAGAPGQVGEITRPALRVADAQAG